MYIAIIILSITGAVAAMILYFISKKFEIQEDPRITQISKILPDVNCGGCGYPGCGGFASACVNADSLDDLSCPVGGTDLMKNIASIIGKNAVESVPKVAVIRCNGTCEACPPTNIYDGAKSCLIASSLYSGKTGCSFGCLGMGDCVDACKFDAIHINPVTGLSEVTEDKCAACEACVKVCPKKIIEIRKKGPKSRRIYVSCANKDKGGVARKACKNACIGCNKCLKECAFEAITITDNIAYIDDTKCRLCRKCVSVCPTGAIHELNFPPQKEAESKQPNTEVATTTAAAAKAKMRNNNRKNE